MSDPKNDPNAIAAELLANNDLLRLRLQEVRAKFDAGDEEWPVLLTQVYLTHSKLLGIDRKLLAPILFLRCLLEDEMHSGARLKTGALAVKTYAAAAVTRLMQLEKMNREQAVRKVARALGIAAKKVHNFRNNFNRHTGDHITEAYSAWCATNKRDEPNEKTILEELEALRPFCKFIK